MEERLLLATFVVDDGTNVIVNGDFETGDLSGWDNQFWTINNGTLDPDGPAGPLAPISGNFDANANPSGPGLRTLSQSFLVPNVVQSATLQFSDRIRNFAGAFQDPNQEYRVLLRDSGGGLIQEIFSTNVGDPSQQVGPNNRQFDLTAALQPFGGQQVELAFIEQDDLFFFNVTLDDVSLRFPDPSAVFPTFETIQEAVDAASDGDTILITGGSDGIHTEPGVTIDKDVEIFGDAFPGTPIPSPIITVQAADNPGGASDRVFQVTNGTTATLGNLEIRNGQASNGGGILNEGTLEIFDSVISQNRAGQTSTTVWGTQPDTGDILRIDPSTGAILDRFSAPDALGPGQLVNGLTIAEEGNSLLYVNAGDDGTSLFRLDPDSGAILSTEFLPGPSFARGGLSFESGTTDSIFAVDNGGPVDRQMGFGGPTVDFTPPNINFPGALGGDDNGRLFVFRSGQIQEFSTVTPNTQLNSFPLPPGVPAAFGLAFAGGQLFLSGPGGSLLTLDPDTGAVLNQVVVSGGDLTGLGAAAIVAPTAGTGGGIFNQGTLTLRETTVTQNTSGSDGGGIRNEGELTIIDSTISANTVAGDFTFGGGISSSRDVEIFGSTISHNVSTSFGSGIAVVNESTLTLVNSTISQNTGVGGGGGGIGLGFNSDASIFNSTITGNSGVGGFSGGIVLGINSELLLDSTIVAGNLGNGFPTDIIGSTAFPPFVTAFASLIGNATTAGGIVDGQDGNIVGNNGSGTIDITTVLNPVLQDNGGPTLTHFLVLGSPAIDAGLNTLGLDFDQRGPLFFREDVAGFADMGAVEVQFFPDLAVGSGGGILAEIVVYGFGVEQFRGNPYPDFFGEVRTAMADVTGDGINDVITGAGPGGGPHIRVFDGLTGLQVNGAIGNFFGFNPQFFGGIYLAAADLNNDTFADIIVGAGESGGPHVRVFSGIDGTILFDFFAFNPSFRGGVRVGAGNVNGVGPADIIVAAGPGGGPHVRVFDGAVPIVNQVANDIGGPLGNFFAYEATYTGGVYVAGSATSNSPIIMTGSGRRIGGPEVKLFSLDPVAAFQVPTFTETRVAISDINRDGTLDTITGSGPTAVSEVRSLSGVVTPPLPFGDPLLNLFPFGQGYLNGVFVAAAN